MFREAISSPQPRWRKWDSKKHTWENLSWCARLCNAPKRLRALHDLNIQHPYKMHKRVWSLLCIFHHATCSIIYEEGTKRSGQLGEHIWPIYFWSWMTIVRLFLTWFWRECKRRLLELLETTDRNWSSHLTSSWDARVHLYLVARQGPPQRRCVVSIAAVTRRKSSETCWCELRMPQYFQQIRRNEPINTPVSNENNSAHHQYVYIYIYVIFWRHSSNINKVTSRGDTWAATKFRNTLNDNLSLLKYLDLK